MRTTQIEVERPDGKIELITKNELGSCPVHILAAIRKATKDAGRGNVIRAIITTECNNAVDIKTKAYKAYNDLQNEGGEGYTPELTDEQLLNYPDYRTWTEVRVVR